MAEFCVSACANAVGTLMVHIVKPMVRPVVSRIRYCFRFRKIVEELHRQENNLIKEKTLVQAEIQEAGLHIETQEIEECVYEWCKNAENVLNEVKGLDRRIGEDEKCYCSCPDWKWRYTLSKEIEKKTRDIGILMEDSHFDRYGRPGKILDLALIKSKDHVDSKSSDDAFNKIMEALKDDNVTKMGVWGMGGVGKTTLVNKVGREVINGFDQVITATVSSEPNIAKIQNNIADFIQGFQFNAATENGKASDLWNRLKRGRFLVILDDLWNEWNDDHDLRQIGIPLLENGKGCKVILTTRRRAVCESMNCDAIIQIDVLNDEEAWALFRMKANLADDEAKGRGFIEEAKKIARECQGLPVAIVTLASALKGTKTRREWEVARENLENNTISTKFHDVEEEKDKDKNAYRCINMSYEYLKKDATKKCFLLCALYPEDHSIDVEDLVRYAWSLELYGKVETVEQLRWKVFKDIDYLLDSCLLLKDEDILVPKNKDEDDEDKFVEVEDGNDGRKVKLHDIVREVALWIASKEENGFIINSRLDLLNESSERCKAVSLLNEEIKKFPECFVQYSQLEMLLLRNCELSGTCLQRMKNLKVLSLIDAYASKRPISLYALKSLQNLRALHLENFKDFSFLGDLRTLEIFSLRGFSGPVEGLACELERLENLRILDLSYNRFSSSTTLPAYVIEKLYKLEELYLKGLKISKDILDVISLSPRLSALSLSLDSDVIWKDYVFPNSLVRYDISIYSNVYGSSDLTEKSWKIDAPGIPYYLVSDLLCEDLESLVLESNIDEFMKVLLTDKGLKLLNLKLLHLQQNGSQLSRLRELPNQQVRLEGLVDLKIVNFPSLKSLFPLSLAQNLVLLETLEIRACNGLEQIVTELEGNAVNSQSPLLCFPKLRKLQVGNCDGLEYIFPRLMSPQGLQGLTLYISKCRQLKQLIRLAGDRVENDLLHQQQQLEFLRSLPSFSLSDCPLLTDSAIHLEPVDACLQGVRLSAFKESFRSSKELTLTAIEDLECLVDNTTTMNGPTFAFTNLERLDVGECSKLQVVLYNRKENQEQSLSNLQSLKLKDLPELSWILKGSAHSFTLQSLKVVKIYACGKLESLFSSSLCLPKLKTLKISDCPKLEYVVPISLAQGFLALASLSISRCSELKQVFSMPNGNHGVEHNRILRLPSLEDLELDSLDKLTSFVPENYIVEAPALKSSHVDKCPRVMSFPIQQVNDQLTLEGVLSSAIKDLLCNTKHLTLKRVGCFGGPKNLVPDVVGIEYLEGLTSLESYKWWGVECLVDSPSTEAMMGSKYKSQSPKLLSNLEHLDLCRAGRLRWIVKGSSNCVNFQSLKFLKIMKCYRLEYLFPLSVLQTLRLLEQLKIVSCAKLKSLFMELESDDDDIRIESNTLCLPNLKTVKIAKCPSLEYVFPHALARGGFPRLQELHLDGVTSLKNIVAGNSVLEAPALEILYIKRCLEITNFTIRKQFNNRFPLKELSINWKFDRESEDGQLGNFEQLFETQGGGYFLSTLETIDLCNLNWLRDIWKAPIHVATNLRQLKVSYCNNLTNIFPVKLIPHLPQLSILLVSLCEKLKQIVGNDDDDDTLTSSSQGVDQLMEMKMVFPQLNEIQLSNLSSLESFSPAGYHLEFPCLEFLDVKNCSKMRTSFSVDYITLTVHAKTHQASQLGDTTSSSAEHIRWGSRYIPTSLPQYVEEEAEQISPLT